MEKNTVLINQGARADATCLLLDGWICRRKTALDGSEQIVGLLLPGDMCDLHTFLLASVDHGLSTLSKTVVVMIPPGVMLRSLEREPRLSLALWRSTLVEVGIAREWLVNLARREAPARLAHLFCELWSRADVVGLVQGGSLLLPLTGRQLAETTGLTDVHVSRSLKVLRGLGLIGDSNKRLTITNITNLARYANFDPHYLQLERPSP